MSSSKWEKDVRCQSVDDWRIESQKQGEKKYHATLHTLKPKPGITVSAKRKDNQNRKTYPESAVPATSAKSHTVHADTEAADTVFVASEDANTLSLQSVPHITSPIIITTEENSAGN